MPTDISMAANTLSIIASIGSLTHAYFSLRSSEENKVSAADVIKLSQQEGRKDFSSVSQYVAMALDGEITETLRRQAEKTRRSIIDKIEDDDLSISDKDSIMSSNNKSYCWHLFQIKKRMKDSFPTDLRNEWDNSNCSLYLF